MLRDDVEQECREDLLARPQLLGLEDGWGQHLDPGSVVSKPCVHQLLVVLAGEERSPHGKHYAGHNTVLATHTIIITHTVFTNTTM